MNASERCFANDYAFLSASLSYALGRCVTSSREVLNVGLQPGGTDGATSFTRWLKFHDSIFPAFPEEKAREAKRDFSGIREENAITAM